MQPNISSCTYSVTLLYNYSVYIVFGGVGHKPYATERLAAPLNPLFSALFITKFLYNYAVTLVNSIYFTIQQLAVIGIENPFTGSCQPIANCRGSPRVKLM